MTTSAASTRARPSATPARSTCRRWSTTWRPRPPTTPLAVNKEQRQVGVTWPADDAALLPHRPERQASPLVAGDDRGRPTRRTPCSTSRSATRRSHPAAVDNTLGTAAVRRVRQERGVGQAQGQDQDRQAADHVHRSHHRHDVLAADRRPQGQGRAQGPHQARAHRQGRDPHPGQDQGLRARHLQGRPARSRSRSAARPTRSSSRRARRSCASTASPRPARSGSWCPTWATARSAARKQVVKIKVHRS